MGVQCSFVIWRIWKSEWFEGLYFWYLKVLFKFDLVRGINGCLAKHTFCFRIPFSDLVSVV